MKRGYSLEGLIVASTALVFLVVGSLLVLAIRNNAATAADEAFDRVLEAAALSIADTVAYVDGEVTVDIPYSAFAILGTSRLNRIFYRVAAPDGEIVTGDPVLGLDMGSSRGSGIRFMNSEMQNEPIRLAAVSRYRSDASTGEAGWIDVFVGETREARSQLAGRLTRDALLPVIAIAVCAFGMVWVGIRLAFSPLRSIERVLAHRSPSNLEPVEENLPREVAALVRTLNDFMERLSSTLQGLRRVTAEAAHQFRTPLAAMRAQAELALEENDMPAVRQRLERIHANAVTTSTLAARLLADATLLHSIKSGQTVPVDLVSLLQRIIEQSATDAGVEDPEAQPSFLHPDHAVLVEGDPTSLGEAIRNVIDNAYIYAGGPIEITLTCSNRTAVVKIHDGGPGIPPDRREKVFERFERNSRHLGGSGLGLAISRDIVTALGGSITLANSAEGGLCVIIDLQRKTPVSQPSSRHLRRVTGALLLCFSLLLLDATEPDALHAQSLFTVAAPLAPDRFAPVLEGLEARFPKLDFVYQQARSTQVAARLSARTALGADLVLMAAPDIAVSITNQGQAERLTSLRQMAQSGSEASWRGELFAVAYDPAVILVSREWKKKQGAELPTSRLQLAQSLEANLELFQRVGTVNVGVDTVSYALAAQDSLRSPLYWRLAAAFGSAQARIYDNGTELVNALQRGQIDVAYNVPLSEVVHEADARHYDVIAPQDYVLGLPWTIFVPQNSPASYGPDIAHFLFSEEGQALIAHVLWGDDKVPASEMKPQRIPLGPELLVYLDTIKRSKFLDSWFELVTAP
ncbi:sensor histidine kinase N-terminal domain-containing protein [Nitratireductor aquimarinus]|uniref:sensor histidine kinase n=1 Tax=Nitratireductor TaxID=245876 RepID=UPI0019D3D956|nr:MULTISPECIES: sensor histidine kinase N-terminal domain-containing protein [Nitratireductor]MBN7778499.1 sensor histidine kinase N-terminal domain-containing protein [Nitratireductor pacificus]MBN7782821.1 sensor histidine kinase N-terminal domain-containing protein [Nitratireductor pacificus]MBN7791628.1 sensor histidine kinase N-terminal domain-containing protein [Nitratireductor aquimarinus]MBY6100886.1 sensor histidine kinase N-terminal domain-containing protein [Nitratireductor aquimari